MALILWVPDGSKDHSPFARALTPGGGVVVGKHIEFDGVDDNLLVGDLSAQIPLNGTATVRMWIKFDQMAAAKGANEFIFTNGVGPGLYQNIANDWFYTVGNDYFNTGAVLSTDRWFHLVTTWSGQTTNQLLYLNGTQYAVTLQGGADDNLAMTNLRFGADSGPASWFEGSLSDIQVWDNVWTEDDVAIDYQRTEKFY